MTPTRLVECLSIVRWTSLDLADALECDVSLVEAWLEGVEEIPVKTAAWIETLATVHLAAERAVRELVAGRPVPTHELVVSLRNFIRKALDLAPIPSDIEIPLQGPTRPSGSGGRGSGERSSRGGGGLGMGGGASGGMVAGSAAGGADQSSTDPRP